MKMPAVAEPLDDGAIALAMLVYPSTLGELDLEQGEQHAPTGGDPGRPLPAGWSALFLNDIEGQVLGAWREATALPNGIAPVIAHPDFESCASSGGCYAPEGDQGVCTKPCPAQMDPDAPADPASAAEPEPPVLTCPTGWAVVPPANAGSIATCAPPTVFTSTCALDPSMLLGATGCVRAGADCGPGEWAVDLPMGAHVLYVSSNPAAGAPFATIRAALAGAAAGDVIAVGKEAYTEDLTVNRAVSIVGACAGKTEIDGSIDVTAPGVSLRGVHVRAASGAITVSAVGAPAALDRMWIEGGSGIGLSISAGASITAKHVVFRGGSPGAISIQRSPTATLDTVVIDGVSGAGILSTSSTLALSDVVVRGTNDRPPNVVGAALFAVGGTVTAKAVFITGAQGGGFIGIQGAKLDLQDTAIADTRSSSLLGPLTLDVTSKPSSAGLVVGSGASATVQRAFVSGSAAGGILVGGQGSGLSVSDLVVQDSAYFGLAAIAGAVVTLQRASFARTHDAAIGSSYSSIDLTNVLVSDFSAAASRETAAVQLFGAQTSVLDHLRIENAAGFGLLAGGVSKNLHLRLDDVTISGVVESTVTSTNTPQSTGIWLADCAASGARIRVEGVLGQGVLIRSSTISALTDLTIARIGTGMMADHTAMALINDTYASIDRVNIDRGLYPGLAIDGHGTKVRISDLVVTGIGDLFSGAGDSVSATQGSSLTLARASLGVSQSASFHGNGVAINEGSSVDIRDIRMQSPSGCGIAIHDSGGMLTLRRAIVDSAAQCGFQQLASTATSSADIRDLSVTGSDVGVEVSAGSRAVVQRFKISSCRQAGATIYDTGALDLLHGTLHSNDTAVRLPNPAYDVRRLFQDVVFSGNRVNFQ
jgi:hypothetical protein